MRTTGRRAVTAAGLTVVGVATLLAAASTAADAATTKPTPAVRKVAAASAVHGMASFSFDDGLEGQYLHARPVLRAARVNGTFYLISDALGWGETNLSPAQAKTLVAEGDEIGNHTRDHADLASLPADEVDAEFAQAQAAIKAQVGVTPTTCAYPYGSSNETVRAIAAKYLRGCRGTAAGTLTRSTLQPFDLLTFYVHSDTTAADVRAAAAAAVAGKTWVIFVYHGVGEVRSSEDVTTEALAAQVQAVKATGIDVRTVAKAYAALGR